MNGNIVNGSVIYHYQCNSSLLCPSFSSRTLTRGYWKLECWGASGGDGYNAGLNHVYRGGLGGYSVGVLFVEKELNLMLTIGGSGLSNASNGKSKFISGGNNGGGKTFIGTGGWPAGSGGGSTDIRLNGSSLEDRIIVAGGGGGAGVPNSLKTTGGFGGHGGGFNGLEGGGNVEIYDKNGGKGGSQNEGGLRGWNSEVQYGENGTLGFGGAGGLSSNHESSCGGGGGGYYGGGGSNAAGGGGGSGYIGGVKSAYYVRAKTLAGDQVFPSPSGGKEKGHLGNGFIRITYVDPDQFITCRKHNDRHYSHSIIPSFIFVVFHSS